MGNRLSKIYTRTGDKGTTGLGDGERVNKDSLRVEAYGTVDELNSCVGLVLASELPMDLRACLTRIQHELFDLGGELCMPGTVLIPASYVSDLERDLDAFNADLPPLKDFILPGGTESAARCHLARTVARRAERRAGAAEVLQRRHRDHGRSTRRAPRVLDGLVVWRWVAWARVWPSARARLR